MCAAAHFTPPRPPSAPLTGGFLNSPSGYSPQPNSQGRRRAPSPDPFHSPAWTGAYTTESNIRASFATASASVSSSPGRAQPAAAVYPAVPAVGQEFTSPGQHQQQQWRQTAEHDMQQQEPRQQHWQVEVVLAGHDADIASVKQSVTRLEQGLHATATTADEAARQVNRLADRVQALEQQSAAAAAPSAPSVLEERTLTPGASHLNAAVAPVGLLNQADLVAAIEGLAADAAQGISRLDALEGTAEQQDDRVKSLNRTCDSLSEQLSKVGLNLLLCMLMWICAMSIEVC